MSRRKQPNPNKVKLFGPLLRLREEEQKQEEEERSG